MKQEYLGRLVVDAGDVVCFSVDSVMKMMKEMGYKNPPEEVEDFIDRFDGVECGFDADGVYGMDKVTAVDEDDNEFEAVLIGAPNNTVKIL